MRKTHKFAMPLTRTPDTKVRYNWRTYNAFNGQGSVQQSASAWESSNPNPVNTSYVQSIVLEWYLFIGGQNTEILGSMTANPNEADRCP